MSAVVSPEEGLLFDLSSRAKLRMSGSDRVRFLNGQVTNDVRKAREDAVVRACVLNAKGKIDADVTIVASGESFLIDADADAREQLAARLERYVIADDVQIEDVTDEFTLFHATGTTIPTLADGALLTASADRFGARGVDIWISRDRHEAALRELSTQLPTCDADCAEVLRIERGIPRWGAELTNEIIPAEANLEGSAIDFAKGCYIGQEVISRMKMSGQTNKRLCGLLPISGAAIAAGMRLVADGKDVGRITSFAQSPRLGRMIALGFVKRGFQEPGTQLDVQPGDGTGLAGQRVEVAALPFV
jgi:tRNA-modifying protein YgfZ